MGPAPMISTASPGASRARSKDAYTQENGSASAASPKESPSGMGQTLPWATAAAGTRTYSANPPSTWMPMAWSFAQWWVRPATHSSQTPQP